jgi:lysophospholipase L1-like esterase
LKPTTRTIAKRAALAAGFSVVGLAAVLGVEVYLALNRDYLATTPALDVGGVFGDAGEEEVTFVVLGDSTAAGVGAGTAERAYPTLLAERLAARGHRIRLVVTGISGARVADVLEHQVPLAVDERPDLVFVGIGANDATHLTPLGEVERDMRAVIDALQGRTSAALVVAGAPDMRAAAFLEPLRSIVGWRGRQVTSVIEEVGRDAGAGVVPLAKRTARFFVEDPEAYYSADDFHPGPAGYERWADAILPELEAALGEDSS